ncbi:DNA polymerase III subunit gamma/tau [Neisseria wadsworthii]|uniref:DNA polymerase III subunit gamma/tau n=1 Tax=Neisseria wadsworthii 9715 TaxID=1030841 RepID=G4CPY5_9NEIS|nr:DNA polymerase III subunit gamma/tau [Neisseria wadsworthii]EGZ47105.1 DNA polymerase III, gamma/tau subunit DnaX [Neisseria wadsworthii 9715]QMT34922.1 DNA polymerase III subunit gamma/tau [Neisseria wadsworthii]
MAYQVLARKWRPKTFADLVGQEHVVKALQNALDKGRLHHAYLLTGTRGVGKTTIARILAKSLNCENPSNGEPCGQCQSCTQIDSGRFVDLLEIDAASNTGIDNIREVLENAQYAPTSGKYKVYIIDEVHMLSKSAFNAMLKTLEEPPEHVKFILATTDPHKVPVTVLSRCLQFVLRNMTPQQVADHLAHVLRAENIPAEPAALQLLGRAAAGSMRDALSLLDQAIAMGSGKVSEEDVRHMIGAVDKRYLYELLQSIAAQNGEALLQKAQEMAARAIGFDSALSELAVLLQRIALFKTVSSAISQDDPERDTLQVLAEHLGDEQIQLYYQCAIHGKRDLSLAPDEYAGFVMTLLRMLAFAPLAAAGNPTNGQISSTELHTPSVEKETEPKKPLVLPDYPEQPPAANEPTTAHIAETASESGTAEYTAEHTESEQAETPLESITEASSFAEAVPVDAIFEHAVAVTASQAEEYSPPWEEIAPEHETSAGEPYPDYPADYPTYDDESMDYFPMPEPSQLEQPNHDEEDETGTEAEEEAAFVPMPEFAAENWAQISFRLSRKLGAAQMLTNHAAWVDFDAENSVLTLSLTANAAKEAKSKGFFDKIRNALAEAYDMPELKLQTCAWEESRNWETPVMRKNRLQIEGRQRAQQILESDPACQKLMNLLDCHEWKADTIELAENIEE